MMFLPFFGFLPCVTANVDPRDLREEVSRICRAAGIPDSIEKLAYALDMDSDLLRRQINGEGHFSWTRVIAKFGKDVSFWQGYVRELVRDWGVSEEDERFALSVMSLFRRNHPLKMAASESQRREA